MTATADSALVPTKIEVLRTGSGGARVVFNLPKTCSALSPELAAKIQKHLEKQRDSRYLGAYSCTAPESARVTAAAVLSFDPLPPPPLRDFSGGCAQKTWKARYDWLRGAFGDFDTLEVEDARCDAAQKRMTLIGTDPADAPFVVSRRTIVPGPTGSVFVVVGRRADTPSPLREAVEGIGESVSIRAVASPAEPTSP